MNLGNRCGELHSYCSLACMAMALLRRLTGAIHLSRDICVYICVCVCARALIVNQVLAFS